MLLLNVRTLLFSMGILFSVISATVLADGHSGGYLGGLRPAAEGPGDTGLAGKAQPCEPGRAGSSKPGGDVFAAKCIKCHQTPPNALQVEDRINGRNGALMPKGGPALSEAEKNSIRQYFGLL